MQRPWSMPVPVLTRSSNRSRKPYGRHRHRRLRRIGPIGWLVFGSPCRMLGKSSRKPCWRGTPCTPQVPSRGTRADQWEESGKGHEGWYQTLCGFPTCAMQATSRYLPRHMRWWCAMNVFVEPLATVLISARQRQGATLACAATLIVPASGSPHGR